MAVAAADARRVLRLRALSAGAAGSVFVATHLENRRDGGGERFALKVPEYSATAARRI